MDCKLKSLKIINSSDSSDVFIEEVYDCSEVIWGILELMVRDRGVPIVSNGFILACGKMLGKLAFIDGQESVNAEDFKIFTDLISGYSVQCFEYYKEGKKSDD